MHQGRRCGYLGSALKLSTLHFNFPNAVGVYAGMCRVGMENLGCEGSLCDLAYRARSCRSLCPSFLTNSHLH